MQSMKNYSSTSVIILIFKIKKIVQMFMTRAIEKCHFGNENIIKSMYMYERGDDDLKSRVYFQMASRQFIYEN